VERDGLELVFALEPNVAKYVSVTVGNRKQLCAMRGNDRFRDLLDRLTVERVDAKELSERAKDALRLLASPKEVRVTLDTKNRRKVRLSFPKEIGKLGLLDLEKAVVVVVFGTYVEFWNPSDWRTFLETIVENQESAFDALESVVEE
jgi:DNA-binding transcriptional regulator/RsmH inhibitor MraZ